MRVIITIGPGDPHRDWVREDKDCDGREALTFESMDPLDAAAFHHRTAPAARRAKPV
jgi:hypothetical protein